MKRIKLLDVALVLVTVGLVLAVIVSAIPSAPHVQNGVVMEVLDPSLQTFAPMWQKEIGRRFPNAVGVLCHGGEFINREWIVSARAYGRNLTAPDIAKFEKAKYPGKTIVLLCCNPGHLSLGIPDVYYANDSVWCVPDRALTPDMFVSRFAREKLAQCTPRCPCGHAATQPALADPDSDDVIRPAAQPPRWEEAPGVLGNIFEFIKD